MRIIPVNLKQTSYPIYIGKNLLQTHIGQLLNHLAGKQVLLVSDATVHPLYSSIISGALPHCIYDEIIITPGEAAKTLVTLETIWEKLLVKQYHRDVTLIALGGGVVGDITGFAAACYQRGVAYLQIPTTLVAQVDAAIGGKTAVNHRLGKNMLGAFYQPHCVFTDISTLNTLSQREFCAGMAEVIKYALIVAPEFFTWLEQHTAAILAREPKALIYMVEKCCLIKADIVAHDTYDQQQRLLLNFGHTFGHAIEVALAYQTCLHGEAVAVGMVLAACYSQQRGQITRSDVDRIVSLLQAYGLPTKIPAELSLEDVLNFVGMDKKLKDGKLRLVVLQQIGRAQVVEEMDYQQLQQQLQAGLALLI